MLIKIINIFCTPYIYNIANALKSIFEEMNIETNIFCRKIEESDIIQCKNNENLYMFLFCPQWIYSGDINKLPKYKYFFYQLEQFDKNNSPHIKNNYVINFMNYSKHIFDYSKINIEYYKNPPFNFTNNKFSLLIPPIPEINKENNKDIDVLFVGSLNSIRRQKILSNIQQNNINITIANNCFGENLSNIISRSKIFLNIRYSNSTILETCRLHEALLSYNTYIISEYPGNSLEKEFIKKYKKRIYFIDEIKNNYSQLIKMIKTILSIYDSSKKNYFDKNDLHSLIKEELINVFNK
jgi:hypothetical protein